MKRTKIYYTGKPKYVTEEEIAGVDFIGDYKGFINCEKVTNCCIYRSKKIGFGKNSIGFSFCSKPDEKIVYAFWNNNMMSCCSVVPEYRIQRLMRFCIYIKGRSILVINKILALIGLEIVPELYDKWEYSLCRRVKK